MQWPKNYLRITLSTGVKRIVPVQRITEHMCKKYSLNERDIFDVVTNDPSELIRHTSMMKWNDAFPCRCMGGIILDWDKEWAESEKELI
jgi:hypothetical protein